MNLPGEACIYCGGRPTRKEHVLPKWLGPVISDVPNGAYAIGRMDAGRPETLSVFAKREMPTEAKVVCQPVCNGGWMSELETQAKSWMMPMIRGQPKTLPSYAQRWLGTWAVKTASMIRYSYSPPEPTPDSRNKWLFTHREPPPGSLVFLACYGGERDGADWIRRTMVERNPSPAVDDEKVHLTAVRLRHLIFLVVEFFSGEQMSVRVPEEWGRAVIQVWPLNDTPLAWPPPLWMSDAGLSALPDIFGPPPQRQKRRR